MASAYDEDLKDNAFYQTFKKDYSEIFYEVIMEGCVICVPRAGSLSSYTITVDDILGHVIIPSDEMPESHFQTLNGKPVKISNRLIMMEYDTEYQLSINILFEETYYTEDLLKYKVLCIEYPLEPKPEGHTDGILELKTLRDCITFLCSESGNDILLTDMDRLIRDLEKSNAMENASVQTLKDLLNGLYTQCVETAFRNRALREKALLNNHTKRNVKIAVETYINHKLYKDVFRWISTSQASENSALNKIIRNCRDVQLRDLDVRAELHDLIPKARAELGKLDGYSTVLGKITCLRKTMAIISKDPESGGMLTTDDVLPIIVFLVLKINITNWCSHLIYLKNFHFSASFNNMGDEDEFLVTTLEAAVEHVKSDVIVVPIWNVSDATPLTCLLRAAAQNDLNGIKSILEEENFGNLKNLGLCHPLCGCEGCLDLIAKHKPSLESLDESGFTALHVAAMYGQPAIIDYILSENVDPNVADHRGYTPLHYAALRGHQHVLLLLLQMGAEANTPDNSLNTPLHLCCNNGHLGCVKALIYHSEHEGIQLLINAQNNNGDTPLHHASKYGYLQIIEILIDNHAAAGLLNKQKLSPFHIANNSLVTEILSKSRIRPKQGLKIKTENFDFIEESPDLRIIRGEASVSAETAKRVDKMLKAVACGDINLVSYYLGLDFNACKQCHPLSSCAKCNNLDKSQKLSLNVCNADGVTALHLSATNGCYELTELLLSKGANPDVQTRSKLATPLILACQNQRINVAKLLLSFGCKINMYDIKANTALHYACFLANRRLVDILLQYDPKLSQRNKSGRTALQEAEAKMALGIVAMLRAKIVNP